MRERCVVTGQPYPAIGARLYNGAPRIYRPATPNPFSNEFSSFFSLLQNE
jgi:hypothetical protein